MTNQFLTNYTEVTFLEKIKDNLRRCKSFAFSVSFIKKAGLVLLFKDIEAAVERGARGRIITSTYQNFTDIESIKSFFALQCKHSNFECHLDYECFHDNHYSTLGYHSKGYLFEFDDCYEVIIGSSNITRYALLKNIEWDVVVRESEPEVYSQAYAEFDDKWAATHLLNSEIINLYSNKLNFAIERWDMDYDLTASNIKPNFMQRKALKELNRYRAVGTSRALVVAAAGSGKTYLAAFDALNFNPKRLLYSSLMCYELTNIEYRYQMRGLVDLLVVPELNKDTNYFANIVESTTRDLHSFVVQVNTSKYGDSRITGPYNTLFKDIIKLKGGEDNMLLTGSIDVMELEQNRNSYMKEMEEKKKAAWDGTLPTKPPDKRKVKDPSAGYM